MKLTRKNILVLIIILVARISASRVWSEAGASSPVIPLSDEVQKIIDLLISKNELSVKQNLGENGALETSATPDHYHSKITLDSPHPEAPMNMTVNFNLLSPMIEKMIYLNTGDFTYSMMAYLHSDVPF